MKFLIYGFNSWIGNQIKDLLLTQNHEVVMSKINIENREEILQELQKIKPDRVINCAGKTGRPNVDWCEDHKIETIRSNILGLINLIDCCYINNIHITNCHTGCLYEYDENHKEFSGNGFKEEDEHNFKGSFYSLTKGYVENIIKFYPNLLSLRFRFCVTPDYNHRSILTKILKYDKIVNVQNSISVLPDLLPTLIDMSITEKTGIYNFVNPGTMSHNEMLDLYIKYVDPNYKYINFTVEEQSKILKAGRSNNELNVDKLLKLYPNIPEIKKSMEKIIKQLPGPI